MVDKRVSEQSERERERARNNVREEALNYLFSASSNAVAAVRLDDRIYAWIRRIEDSVGQAAQLSPPSQ